MTAEPRILFLDQSGMIGGAELSLLGILQDGIPGHVFLFQDGPFRKKLEKANIAVTVSSTPGASIPVTRKASYGKLFRAVRTSFLLGMEVSRHARGFDLLVANTQKAMVIGCIASIISRKPLIWFLRDILSPEHFSGPARLASVFLSRFFVHRIIANSLATQEAYITSGGKASLCEIVYNAIDPTPFLRIPKTADSHFQRPPSITFLAGNFSRLAQWKGQDIMLAALSQLPEAGGLFVGDALFGGDGDYKASLERLTRELGLETRTFWPGFRSDIPELMNSCDVIVHTSIHPEPFGRVLVEGMMAGKPVIATNLGGAREIITNEITGLLIPPNDPIALKKALEWCLDHPEAARIMAERGRAEAISRFSPDAILPKIRKVFHSASDKSGP